MSDALKDKNDTIVAIAELLECPICFNNIVDNDPYYIMACCKNRFHLPCLVDWYSTHLKQSTCFMCNQPNNFCREFLDINDRSSNNINNSSDNINDLSDVVIESSPEITNTSRDNLSTPMLNRNNSSNNRTCSCAGFFTSVILGGLTCFLLYLGIYTP